MRYLSTQTNHLQMEVESGNLLKKGHSWKKIDDEGISVAEFPIYTEEEIRELTLGVYQVRLARYYTQEHIDPDHEYCIWVDQHVPGLLAAKIQSRHVSSKCYLCWIRLSGGVVTTWY